jgi:hypothetical protein
MTKNKSTNRISNKLKVLLFLPVLALLGAIYMGGGSEVYANADAAAKACEGVAALGVTCDAAGSAEDVIKGPVQVVVQLLTYIVGVASVVMIIYGALKFITSGGNSDATKSAKSTIIYALVGLTIVLLANVIISFVFNQAREIENGPAPSGSSGCVDDPATAADECADEEEADPQDPSPEDPEPADPQPDPAPETPPGR